MRTQILVLFKADESQGPVNWLPESSACWHTHTQRRTQVSSTRWHPADRLTTGKTSTSQLPILKAIDETSDSIEDCSGLVPMRRVPTVGEVEQVDVRRVLRVLGNHIEL